MNYELAGASSRFRARKTATLQFFLNRAEQKQRSCDIFFNSKLIHKHEMNKN
jgi:hypothetical protein